MNRRHEANGVRSLAVFSDDERYRYYLSREWGPPGEEVKRLNFLMLNPSTADERKNDPTVERCQRRAKNLGYDGIVVTNLFAFRATDPKTMKAADDPIGPDNDGWITNAFIVSEKTICAWGSHGSFRNRSADVRRMLSLFGEVFALALTAAGEPRHPLYLSYELSPVPLAELPK